MIIVMKNRTLFLSFIIGFLCLATNCKNISENFKGTNKNLKRKKLDKLYFLIHGFCYADMTHPQNAGDFDGQLKCFLERENKCAQKWRSEPKHFSETEALIIIPWPGHEEGPVSDYNSLVRSILGDRCFILDCADCNEPSFWSDYDQDFYRAVLDEFKSAFVKQNETWNKEELHTALHSLACCQQLHRMLNERGYYFDKKIVSAESWGASFDGCVTKYTLNIKRILDLTQVININFDLTVPDAPFLLEAILIESVLLKNGLKLFIFKAAEASIALYTMTSQSLGDQAAYVQLKFEPGQVTVKSKQGIRLWPQPELYHLPNAAIGNYEPPQQLVKFENKRLHVPVSSGFVYRLAKAPAYIFAAPEMTYNEFREVLVQAEIQ